MTQPRSRFMCSLALSAVLAACSADGNPSATSPSEGGDGGNAGSFSSGGATATGGSQPGAGTAGAQSGGGTGGTFEQPPPRDCTTAAECNDGNACTDEACTNGSCAYTANTVTCDDRNACTTNDACNNGACQGEALLCDDNAGNPCIADACNPASGCTTTLTTDSCDDGDPCTDGDVCNDGVCAGSGSCAGGCDGGLCSAALPITPLAMGWAFTCARRDDATIRCWGQAHAQPSTAPTDKPFGVPIDFMALGDGHGCVVTNTGTMRCWGSNGAGETGNVTEDGIVPSSGDVSQLGDIDVGGKVVHACAGMDHTCAVLDTGAVRCWGDSDHGQLGYGDGTDYQIGDDETPASKGDVDIGGSAVQVACGGDHTCALMATGDVRCWGWGTSGVLGDTLGSTVGDNEAPSVRPFIDMGGPVVQLAAGRVHSCALLANGTVRCWGNGGGGPLGYASIEDVGDDETPAEQGPVNVGGGVTQIALGTNHSCALLSDRTVRCWGTNQYGQLGYGHTDQVGATDTPADQPAPVDVGGDVAFIAAGGDRTCAVRTNGDIYCWGNNELYALGYPGTTEHVGDDETPASVGPVPWLD